MTGHGEVCATCNKANFLIGFVKAGPDDLLKSLPTQAVLGLSYFNAEKVFTVRMVTRQATKSLLCSIFKSWLTEP